MTSTEELRRQIAKEESKIEVEKSFTERNRERKRLKQKLQALRQRKVRGVAGKIARGGATVAKAGKALLKELQGTNGKSKSKKTSSGLQALIDIP